MSLPLRKKRCSFSDRQRRTDDVTTASVYRVCVCVCRVRPPRGLTRRRSSSSESWEVLCEVLPQRDVRGLLRVTVPFLSES